ncbi:unnamed protein product [Caenorhabditis auriculariae]|uniref:Uncharacterized protein n=1 Tax=Caenorhabditis auriculariae TaxID=2777116 RepID=A0A8S1GY94_9PELO|nr:unnamed protein product [Caenorhabditis auriculariae]
MGRKVGSREMRGNNGLRDKRERRRIHGNDTYDVFAERLKENERQHVVVFFPQAPSETTTSSKSLDEK